MTKKYNIASQSDMRQFSRDLEKTLREKTEQAVKHQSYEAECPFCKQKVMFHPGQNVCPHCHKTVDFKLDINWK